MTDAQVLALLQRRRARARRRSHEASPPRLSAPVGLLKLAAAAGVRSKTPAGIRRELERRAAQYATFLERRAARKPVDPGNVRRVRAITASEYRAAMVKRKGGPNRTRATHPRKTRDVGGHAKRIPVAIECRMERCKWSGSGRSWRVARRARDAHQADKHR